MMSEPQPGQSDLERAKKIAAEIDVERDDTMQANCRVCQRVIPFIAAALAAERQATLAGVITTLRELPEGLLEAMAVSLCCGDNCDAANCGACFDMSVDGYAEKYGCMSKELQDKARSACIALADWLAASPNKVTKDV
jgi:hypothetical protein